LKGEFTVGGRSKVVDEDEARRLLGEEGYTYPQMVVFYRNTYGVETTVSMWSRFYKREFGGPRQPRRYHFVPWKLPAHTASSRDLNALRLLDRALGGEKLNDTQRRTVHLFQRALIERDQVIDFDPADGRTYRVPRRRGVDQSWIRDPFLKDDGTLETDLSWIRFGALEERGIGVPDDILLARPLPDGEKRRQD
jgi:hypothetical protein